VWFPAEWSKRREVERPEVLPGPVSVEVARTAEDRDPIRPPEVMLAVEAVERTRTSGRLSRPSVLLTGCRPWAASYRGDCPACLGRPLRPAVYCLRCDRWGLDSVLRRLERGTRSTTRPTAAAMFRPKLRRVAR